MNKRLARQVTALLLVIALLAPGCATTSDTEKTKAQGTGIGVAAGALAGGLLGKAFGGDRGAVIGAGLGAILGGAAGHKFASNVASRKEKYASEEDRLNGEIAQVEKYNTELAAYNDKSIALIEKLDKDIAALNDSKEKASNKAKALKKKEDELNKALAENEKYKKEYGAELTALNEYLENLRQSQQEQQQEQQRIKKLEVELAQLKTNIDMLDSNNREIAQMVQSLNVRK